MLPTTGLGIATMSLSRPSTRSAPSFMPPLVASLRSAPAQNVFPVWVSSTARTPASKAAVASACVSWATIAAESAFRFRGESSAILAIPRLTEYCTSSSGIAAPL